MRLRASGLYHTAFFPTVSCSEKSDSIFQFQRRFNIGTSLRPQHSAVIPGVSITCIGVWGVALIRAEEWMDIERNFSFQPHVLISKNHPQSNCHTFAHKDWNVNSFPIFHLSFLPSLFTVKNGKGDRWGCVMSASPPPVFSQQHASFFTIHAILHASRWTLFFVRYPGNAFLPLPHPWSPSIFYLCVSVQLRETQNF